VLITSDEDGAVVFDAIEFEVDFLDPRIRIGATCVPAEDLLGL
jgi:hypothetical protein